MIPSEIRFLALERDFEEFREEYEAAWRASIRTGRVVGGIAVEQFEEEVAKLTGRKHAVAVSSGTDALWIALVASGVSPGFTAIVPAISFIATASAVVRVGAAVRFVDVDEYCHGDLNQLEELIIRYRPAVVVAVGLFGNGLDGKALMKLCNDRDALLIEDAAQSFGSFHRGARGGGLGRTSALSFAPTKPVACFGNAGAVAADDEQIVQLARVLRTHGKATNRSPSRLAGGNCMLASSHGAQLVVSLRHRDQRSRRRKQIAERYLTELARIDRIQLPRTREGCIHNWHKFVITTNQRDNLAGFLSKIGIETQIHYPIPLPDEPILATFGQGYEFPRSRAFSGRCLSLPLHPHLTDDEVSRVIAAIYDFHA